MTRRPLSHRFVFTGLMSGLATIFGSYLSIGRIAGQDDILTDIAKIAVIIAVGTAGLSYGFWTVFHGLKPPRANKPNPLRGAFAGALTALFVVPLPVFAWQLKTDLLAAYAVDPLSVFGAILTSVPHAVSIGLLSFAVITKASITAVILSAALGYSVSRWYPRPPAGTSPRQL